MSRRVAILGPVLAVLGCGSAAPEPSGPVTSTAPVPEMAEPAGLVRAGTCWQLGGDPPTCSAPEAFAIAPEVSAALERCFRDSDDARGGRLAVVQRGDERELIGPATAAPFVQCLAEALAEQPLDGDHVCTLALVPGGPIDAPPWAARLEVTRSRVALDGQHVIHTHLLQPDELPVETGRQLDSAALLADKTRAGGVTDLVVRAHPAVDGAVVARALGAFVRASAPRLLMARAVGLSEVWAVVDPLGSNNDLPCRMEPLAVEVAVQPDRIEVVVGGRARNLPGSPAEALPALETALSAARKEQPARVDLGFTLGPGVAYRDLLRALELAVSAGFWDLRLRGPDPSTGGF